MRTLKKLVRAVLPLTAAAMIALPATGAPWSGQTLAQATPSAPATPSPSASEAKPKLSLTPEDREFVKRIIVDEMKIAPPASAKRTIAVGETIPNGIPLQPIPVEVSARIPALLPLSFIVQDGAVLIVDPRSHRIADKIE
jgi:hypothetical protein